MIWRYIAAGNDASPLGAAQRQNVVRYTYGWRAVSLAEREMYAFNAR
jgi:hypothetical protein